MHVSMVRRELYKAKMNAGPQDTVVRRHCRALQSVAPAALCPLRPNCAWPSGGRNPLRLARAACRAARGYPPPAVFGLVAYGHAGSGCKCTHSEICTHNGPMVPLFLVNRLSCTLS